MGALQIGDKAGVKTAQRLSLRHRFTRDRAVFNDLIRQATGMQRQLFIGGKQFALLLFQHPFSRESPAPFLCQLFRQVHSMTSTRFAFWTRPLGQNIRETK